MTAIGFVMVIFSFLGIALVAVLYWGIRALIAQEVAQLVPSLTNDLLRRAAKRLPKERRSLFLEEWQGEIQKMAERRPLLALVEAISLYRGARRIAWELEPASIPVGAAGIPRRLGAFGDRIARYMVSGSSKKSFAFLAGTLTLCVAATIVALFLLLELVFGL